MCGQCSLSCCDWRNYYSHHREAVTSVSFDSTIPPLDLYISLYIYENVTQIG